MIKMDRYYYATILWIINPTLATQLAQGKKCISIVHQICVTGITGTGIYEQR